MADKCFGDTAQQYSTYAMATVGSDDQQLCAAFLRSLLNDGGDFPDSRWLVSQASRTRNPFCLHALTRGFQ
ncbi:hypothetical protein D9M70_647250 [compost metagenome]